MRGVIILIVFVFFSCGKKSDSEKKVFKKDKILEYVMGINKGEVVDTTFINETKFNNENQILEVSNYYMRDNSKTITKFLYNGAKHLIKEVYDDTIPSGKDYTYKNNKLYQVISYLNNGTSIIKGEETFNYTQDSILTSSNEVKVFIDSKTNTVFSKLSVFNLYGSSEQLIESKKVNHFYPEDNTKAIYHYNSNIISVIEKFDFRNKLITKTKFDYQFNDKLDWVERKCYVNDTLRSVNKRVIDYVK